MLDYYIKRCSSKIRLLQKKTFWIIYLILNSDNNVLMSDYFICYTFCLLIYKQVSVN